ncbi:glutaminyl-peptide cyclotransferase [Luteibacter yeojuensis]|uniref:Glutaminyl-peptide cyclotransferase n=1 Tax=Luteibacter yeojuensis TaxID=345309 RepID=A0A7X5QXG6_9GAMM|nr:glutaminyl-peptide cyclotransferase [Luteibacter yeojuensis]NID17218.1 glutaminyl-peptide cyclotransferase [Luteibacter yeojuensis]
MAIDVPTYTAHVVHIYPHDRQAFTEGLYYEDGFLFESTGGYVQAGVRKVRLDTAEVVQQRETPLHLFGEGIVASGSKILQLTWQEGIGFLYDRKSFALLGQIRYPGEGWAMTRNASHIFMSDGTPRIRILDPDSFAQTGSIDVTVDGQPLRQINELEWVKGEIYANVWQTSRIARIDPATGHVTGWIDLGNLAAMQHVDNPADDVLNGIAYDAAHDRLFVTGKCWDAVYEIKVGHAL